MSRMLRTEPYRRTETTMKIALFDVFILFAANLNSLLCVFYACTSSGREFYGSLCNKHGLSFLYVEFSLLLLLLLVIEKLKTHIVYDFLMFCVQCSIFFYSCPIFVCVCAFISVISTPHFTYNFCVSSLSSEVEFIFHK